MNKEWKYLALFFQIFSVIAYAENNPPIGNIESVIGSVIHGWACDPDEPNKGIEVHFYADNTFDKGGNIIGIVVANLPSDATINVVCKGGTSHRFEYTFQRYEKSCIGPGDHPVYAYGIDTANGVNPLLYNSPAILNVTGAKITLHAVDNINTNCHFYADQNWNLIQPALGTCDSWAAWIIRGTNEDSAFFNPKYFLPNDSSLNGTEHASSMRPYWFYEFHSKGDGTYQVGWVVDKVNFPQDLNQYSAAFINDVNLTTLPDIGDNIFIDIRVGLFANEQVYDSSVGLSKNRTAIGMVSSWSNNPQAFLEVNLFRTENFDLCTSNQNLGGTHPSSNCDTKGIYDRRSNYGNGEIVYYDINNMSKVTGYPQSELAVDGGIKSFTIPISQLFRKYSWARPPATWYGVKIEGIYIGHEVWGKGRVWTEFDNYQIYSFVAD